MRTRVCIQADVGANRKISIFYSVHMCCSTEGATRKTTVENLFTVSTQRHLWVTSDKVQLAAHNIYYQELKSLNL